MLSQLKALNLISDISDIELNSTHITNTEFCRKSTWVVFQKAINDGAIIPIDEYQPTTEKENERDKNVPHEDKNVPICGTKMSQKPNSSSFHYRKYNNLNREKNTLNNLSRFSDKEIEEILFNKSIEIAQKEEILIPEDRLKNNVSKIFINRGKHKLQNWEKILREWVIREYSYLEHGEKSIKEKYPSKNKIEFMSAGEFVIGLEEVIG